MLLKSYSIFLFDSLFKQNCSQRDICKISSYSWQEDANSLLSIAENISAEFRLENTLLSL